MTMISAPTTLAYSARDPSSVSVIVTSHHITGCIEMSFLACNNLSFTMIKEAEHFETKAAVYLDHGFCQLLSVTCDLYS